LETLGHFVEYGHFYLLKSTAHVAAPEARNLAG
jgi:hypothetical protein